MDATTIDSRIAALHADDGVIEQSFAELDARLVEWLVAMREGQTALLVGVRQVIATPETDSAAEHPPPADDEPEPNAALQRGSGLFRQDRGNESSLDTGGPETEHESGKTGPDPLPSETAPADSEVAAPKVDDDEALLSSLDPETANTIRVKRRLTGNKRTVRELLDEMRSGRTGGKEADPQRKRWWR